MIPSGQRKDGVKFQIYLLQTDCQCHSLRHKVGGEQISAARPAADPHVLIEPVQGALKVPNENEPANANAGALLRSFALISIRGHSVSI